MPDFAPILANKFNILRNQEMPKARLFLFKEGTTAARALVPIVFDVTKEAGEVLTGWRVNPRRFDRFGAPFLEIQIARTKKYTAEALAPVRGFCVIRRGELTGTIQRCEPAGIAALATEPVWKFTATGRTSQVHELPGAPPGEMELETGSNVELETGSNVELEA